MSAEDIKGIKEIKNLGKILGCYRSKEKGQKLRRKVVSRWKQFLIGSDSYWDIGKQIDCHHNYSAINLLID